MLALVLGGVAVAWIGAAVFAYRDARHETDELLDGYLAQSAALIVAQAGEDLDELQLEHAPQLHRYARRVAFQIWDGGKSLRTHSANAPDRRLSPRTEGFDEVEVDGQNWRVFSSYDPHRKILVQVGEARNARDAIALAVARGLAAPMVVALPVLGVLLWIAVTLGLAPLRAVGRAVARRDPANLAPLDVGRLRVRWRRSSQASTRCSSACERRWSMSAVSLRMLRTNCARQSPHCGRRLKLLLRQTMRRSDATRSVVSSRAATGRHI